MADKYNISDEESGNHLAQQETTKSMTISMETFEKLYLAPQNRVKGQLRNIFGNPTPLPLLGFLLAVGPLACAFMGWRGAGGNGAATIGVSYFFGGLLQLLGGILEWFIGNTFPFVVFGSFGAFWLAFAATQTPSFNAIKAFTSTATTEAEIAAAEAEFMTSLAFFICFLGVVVFFYLICSIRINVVFVLIFLTLDIAIFLLTVGYWKGASGDTAALETLQKASGAFLFALFLIGMYLLLAQLLQSVDFPVSLPVGDLSKRIKGRKQKSDQKET